MSTEPEKVASELDASDAREATHRSQIETDESKVVVAYANFCRVMGTPEELIVDYGLNPQPVGAPTHPIQISQRIVMNYFTAKRLLAALQMSVQRHEQVFGTLETDVQKRMVPRRGK